MRPAQHAPYCKREAYIVPKVFDGVQNLASLQLKNWDDLKYVDDRCMTQLGGCCVVGEGGDAVFSWVDGGLCDVVDMHDVLAHI